MEPNEAARQESRTTDAEIQRVEAQVTGQLEERGVLVHDDDTPADRADILTAVEEFERAVRLRGGDSYTNAPQSSDPDREDFVIPRRRDDERAAAYIARVRSAAARLAPPNAAGDQSGSAV